MRSIQLLEHHCVQVSGAVARSRSFVTTDQETQTVYIAFEDNDANVRVFATGLAPDDPFVFSEIARIPSGSRDTGNNIVDFAFLSDQQVVCLATRAGDIALISKERFENGDEATEIVGSVDAGIAALAWSPDQDLVVLVTGEKNVLEMTKDFDTITEYKLHVEEQGEGVQHSVGWGRKETQFHGSAGKQAAQYKADTSKFTTSADDDKRVRIAWRGDGSFFTISDVDPERAARVVRVFNREGRLQNTSEPVDQLEHVLDWRPSGNLIVSSQRLPHRHDIVFIERNGLRHGEFTLREKTNHQLLEVSWNADSTVLAIWMVSEIGPGGKKQQTVQLWTSNNYYWYMKQHIVLGDGEDITGFAWDTEHALCAHIMSSGGKYHQFKFCWDVITSTSTSEENSGYVSVIDGASVLLTPFSYQNVPPPMCSLTLPVDDNVQQVSFGQDPSGCQIAVMTNQKVQFFTLPANGRGDPVSLGALQLPLVDARQSGVIRQLQWIDETKLAYIQYDEDGEADVLCIAEIDIKEGKLIKLAVEPLGKKAARLHYNVSLKDLIIVANDGSIFKVIENDGAIQVSESQKLAGFCPWIGTARIGQKSNTQDVVIGLTERGKLYANDRLLSAECTSFFLRSDWLVFTTTSHTARFLPLHIDLDEFKLSDGVPDAYDESSRRVERGSKIVLATQSKPALVLQMPRGNLETVSPRAFTLAKIREDLKNHDYRSAFLSCRRNRIDLNVLYDENPQEFLENIPRFIKQVPEVDFLNLFLSNLRNEDTTQTMYCNREQTAEKDKSSFMVNKVNNICEAFRNVLMTLGRQQYIQSILSTYVKSTPPDLESALKLLADIKETNMAEAEEALKYTIFLCNADRLYDVALGMYNFPLVLMVAQQAQKDPREYLPFLQELQKLEKFYQRFRIDDHLNRHVKALVNLCKAGDKYFDEAMDYMKKHALYKTGLNEYAQDPEKKQIILDAYGDYLSSTQSYDEAGIVYRMANQLEKALEAYRMAGTWRECFSLAKQLKYSEEDIRGLASIIIDYLRDKRRYQDAAIVANDYANDIEDAVDCLLKGNHWDEAVRQCYRFDRADLIETNVKPGLLDGYSQVDEDIDEMITQFNKQTARLKELREKKPEQAPDLPPDETLDNIDMFSDTTSMYSMFTRYSQTSVASTISSKASRKTSKLRRREERKRARGKKGTVFEEEYLVNSLKRLYEKASSMQNDLANLLKALVPFGHSQEAKAIQNKFSDFLDSLNAAIPTIFVPLQLATGRFADPEDVEAAKEPVPVEKPTIATVKWKLEILD